ncbi:MAG: uracil phosphoribosyltransferase [Flavobacteriales bacterium]
MVNELSKQHSIFNQYILEIRDEHIQKDAMRFRRNIERIGEIMAYEISKTFTYEAREVTTPLGVAEVHVPSSQPLLCTILRAGLPMHQGMLNIFDHSDSAFVAAFRKHDAAGNFEIEVDYVSAPPIDGSELVICDPMLATGFSLEKVYKKILQRGKPSRVHIACIIASESGLSHLRSKLPEGTHFWVGAIDSELTAHSYIVPGLGDAGDLAFGIKE